MRIAIILMLTLLPALSFGAQGPTKKLQPLPKELQGTIPNFDVLAIDNKTELSQNDLKAAAQKTGAKRIVLSFFASWCEKCMAEFELLKKNTKELKKNGLQVFLIDVGENIGDKGDLVSKMVSDKAGGLFPFYFDPNANLFDSFGILPENKQYALPTIIVLDLDLRVLGVFQGETGNDFPQILWGKL